MLRIVPSIVRRHPWAPKWLASPHPIFREISPWRGQVTAGYWANFLGQRTSVDFGLDTDQQTAQDRFETTRYPAVDGEFFDWVAILESVIDADREFVMIEGGAGIGYRLVSAACAARSRRPDLKVHLIGVEAEPTHFEWMHRHFRDNGLDPDAHHLIPSAIDATDGEVTFTVGNAGSWYGQAISDIANEEQYVLRTVPSVSVNTLLAGVDHVDLLHFDIQGAEFNAIAAAIESVTAKVRRAFIGTHSKAIETGLIDQFTRHGWLPVHVYSIGERQKTPYGWIGFGDGVQYWMNPRLAKGT